MKRRALLILGMHRAGTSALARVAGLRGACLPKHVMPANAGNTGGYWEPEAIVRLNDRILGHYATSWDDPFAARLLPAYQDFPQAFAQQAAGLIQDEYEQAELILIKDPRCTLLHPFWHSVLRQAGIEPATVVIVRPWIEVVDSLMRRDGTSAVGGALLYIAYGLEIARQMDAATTCLTYESLMADWRAATERIADTQGFTWPRSPELARAQIEAYLRPGARHKVEQDLPEEVHIWADAIWEWFRAAASADAPRLERLGPIADRLDALMELAGPLLQDRKHARDRVVEALDHSQATLAATAIERDGALEERDLAMEERNKVLGLYHNTDALLERTNIDYQRLDRAHVDLQQALIESQQARAELENAHDRLSSELALVYGSRSWRLTAPLRWVTGKLHRSSRREPSLAFDIAGEGQLVAVDHQAKTGSVEVVEQRRGLRAYLTSEFGLAATDRIVQRIDRYRLPMQTTAARAAAAVDCSLEAALVWAKELAHKAGHRHFPTTPDVSIVVPIYNQLPFTLACIDALLAHDSRYSLEILIGDDASTDHSQAALAVPIQGLQHIRHNDNLGFVRNCNQTAQHAQGRYLVFLNNDTQVLPGWLDELIGTLESDPGIGLAGSKLIYPDGRLQECGAIVWRDGSAWNYGRLADPRRPEYCYLRDVDYVSGASIALRRQLWQDLEGFDELFVPAYAEDADLAFRVRAKALRTVVQPLSQALHFEGISSGTDTGSGIKSYQTDHLRKLHERWADVLQGHRANADMPELEKERAITRRALFVDHCTPNPREDAGSVVAFEVMKSFGVNGYKVTFVPEDNFAHMGGSTRDLQRIGIEAIYHPAYWRISDLFAKRNDDFDVVFLHRFGVADKHMNALRRSYPRARMIFLNADMHFLRETRQAELSADPVALSRAKGTKRRELRAIADADVTLVHSDFELALLKKALPDARVVLFPLIHDPVDMPPPLGGRSGVCFVGGFRHPPNADGIGWFVRECWPLVLARRPDAKLYIVGSHVTAAVQELGRHIGVEVVGFIEDLEGFLAQRRATVAALRYGAGAKGKVAVSLAQGVPVACTPAAAEGMHLIDGENVLVGDGAQALAEHVVKLLTDDAAWHRLSQAGLDYARNYTSRTYAVQRLRSILEN